jgi:kynurenine 3-monooxygenase
MRCKPWRLSDKALLIGDAAHAIVPFHGQGMNCGFEDCEYLDQLLAEHDDFQLIFEAFEKERKKNADAIADMALDNYIEMRDLVRDPEFIESRQIALALSKRFGDAFMPRYSMVMFETLPYSEAQRKGEIQKSILSTLAKQRLEDHSIDFKLAEKLISERL